MVGDEHQIAGLPLGVDTAGGVGDDELRAAQQGEHPHRIGDLFIAVTLVVVHPALHDGHVLALELTEDQLALVAGGGGSLEVGDVLIRDGNGVFHLVAQEAQTGAQDHGYLRGEITDLLANIIGAGLIVRKFIMKHQTHPPL